MKKIILTGFEPFGEYQYNPTKDLVEYFKQKPHKHLSSVSITAVLLPCTYKGAFEILSKHIDEIQPHAVISTGLSSSVGGIRIETVFRNIMYSKYKDANGDCPDGVKIQKKRPVHMCDAYPNSEGYQLAQLLIERNIPVEISHNANTFICNSLGFLTSDKIYRENLPTKNMFLHVPWTDDYAGKIKLEPDKVLLMKSQFYDAIIELVENI
jgi:pyroglutamyl-peptidase